ncbi:unnamed protein product [Boreogadus saida]
MPQPDIAIQRQFWVVHPKTLETIINADAGRVFSVVGLNKTKTRNSLALDGTLSSIMTIKMADLEPCFKWEPPSDVLKASKKATGQYNRTHRSGLASDLHLIRMT